MTVNCDVCGSPSIGDRYCRTCGSPVQTSPAGQHPLVAVPPPPPPPAEAPLTEAQWPPPAATQLPPPRQRFIPPPPPPPDMPTTYVPAQGPRRRGVAVLAGVLVLVVLAAGVGAYLLLRPGSSDATADGTVASSIPAVSITSRSLSAGGGSAAGVAPATTGSVNPQLPASGGSAGAPSATASSPPPGTTAFVPVPAKAAADCTAPAGVDAAGATQTYEPEKAIDGKKETAWRCPGDAAGRTLVVDFGGPVQLTSVGLIPGFDKIDPVDGADRYQQGRKIIRVRWTFDDGTSVETAPNGERSARPTTVSVRTSIVRIAILETRPGTSVVNKSGVTFDAVDTSAVSEVVFTGLK